MDDVDTRPAAVVDAGAEDLAPGTVLSRRGDRTVDFFIVLHGRIEITEPAPDNGDRVITVHAGQQFTGELDLFNDRLILGGGRIGAEGGRVACMNRAAFRRMLAAEPDIDEVVMRAFILRRVGFIEHGQAGVILVAPRHEGVGDSLRIQRFLGRNGNPVRMLDIDRPGAKDARTVLAAQGCSPDDVPVVVCGPGRGPAAVRAGRGLGHGHNRAVLDAGRVSGRDHHRGNALPGGDPAGDQAVPRPAARVLLHLGGLGHRPADAAVLARGAGSGRADPPGKGRNQPAASLLFRWSVPGSIQLGFLLAQGSEFAFVILSLPPVRALVGERASAVLITATALTLAATPSVAEAGRALAGRLRRRAMRAADPELQPREVAAPVLIAGMGRVGRTLADALIEFDVGCTAIERDQTRLREAVADGYDVAFGDFADPRIWEPVMLHGRRISVLTAPLFEVSRDLAPAAQQRFPGLVRIAVVPNEAEAERFRSIGVLPVTDRSLPPGLDLAAQVLAELGVDSERIGQWMRRDQECTLAGRQAVAA